jgi:hypothetical protein
VICSIFLVSSPALDAGDAMMGVFRDVAEDVGS